MRPDRIEAEFADPCDARHSARVAGLAERLARWLDWDEGRRGAIRLGSVLHDVGKLTVSQAVLRKPGQLTQAELDEVRLHPSAGAWLVAPVSSLCSALPCILLHHERWDGSGYPTGRRTTGIPVEARLLAVVDAFDAMVSDRPYREAMPVTAALAELERGAGTQFDPALSEAFVSAWKQGAFDPERATEFPRPRASNAFG